MFYRNANALVLLLLFGLLACPLFAAQKTDVVYMQNGDRVTGEIKSLFRGRLEFKTDHMGTLLIDWEDIREVVSRTGQAVELTSGQRYYGPLERPEAEDMVAVATEQGTVALSVSDVTNMYPVKASFWERLELSFRLGFNWDKSSEVGKYNLGAGAVFRDPDFVSRARFTSEFTTQKERDTSTRANLNVSHLRFLPDSRFRTYFGNLDHNEALGIRLRTLAGIGYGWFPLRTTRSWFSLMAGLAINHEIPTSGREDNTLEGVLGASYEYFKFAVPKKSLVSDLLVYPSLTGDSRLRAEFNTKFDLELISDLYWEMELYTSYDSDPISQDAETVDYGVNSSFAYKF
jgi:hypothetical protein